MPESSKTKPTSSKAIRKRNIGEHADEITLTRKFYTRNKEGQVLKINGKPVSGRANTTKWVKVDDLRYGENPSQTGAFYARENGEILNNMRILKTGKQGLSLTNLQDMYYGMQLARLHYSLPETLVIYLMKHLVPCGGAMWNRTGSKKETYLRAWLCAPQDAYGNVTVMNQECTDDLADEIMNRFTEGVVAPSFTQEALDIFNTPRAVGDLKKLNHHIRIVQINLDKIPRFAGDDQQLLLQVMPDGSLVEYDMLLFPINSLDDLKAKHISGDKKVLTHKVWEDLYFAMQTNYGIRSNGCCLAKAGELLAVGTGQQNRLWSTTEALLKVTGGALSLGGNLDTIIKQTYGGQQELKGAVCSQDGFVFDKEIIDYLRKAGVVAMVQPGGSINDQKLIDYVDTLSDFAMIITGAETRMFRHM